MRKFSCDEARAHLSDALASEIGRPEANVLEAHLLDCDPCRDLSELFCWQDRVIAELAAQARIDALMSKVREGLRNLDQVTFEEEHRRQWAWQFPTGWVAAAAAFILALVAVLYWRPQIGDPVAALQPNLPKATEAPPVVPQPAENPKAPEDPVPQPPIENPIQPPTKEVEGPKPPPVIVHQPKDPVPAPPKDPTPKPPRQPDVVAKVPDKKDVVQKVKTLDDAVRGGMAFLKAKAAVFAKESKNDELLLWTYVHGGMAESDGDFQALLKSITSEKANLDRTYNVALTAMVLEELDRVKYWKRIAQCAQFLVDNQCPNGQWGYGNPSIFVEEVVMPTYPPKYKGPRRVVITRKRDGQGAGDNSNTQYALLGLRACHDAGVVVPRQTVEQAAKWLRDSQTRTATVKGAPSAAEGWCYSKHDHKPYGSMTVGGVGGLVICDYILGVDWKKDQNVQSGMDWLAKNFSVSYNPGPYEHAGGEENSQHQYYYYMYGLERAGMLYGAEQIGGHYWFAKGLQALVDAQGPDGSWRTRHGDAVQDTCFAILFLRKATRALVDTPTQGAGAAKPK
jgi:hypothetical protein